MQTGIEETRREAEREGGGREGGRREAERERGGSKDESRSKSLCKQNIV